MRPFKILYVDDEEINLINFKLNFQHDYEIITALSGSEGINIFSNTDDIGLVISDQRMAGMTGVQMLATMYRMDPDPLRIVLTAYSQIEDIMDAINQGHIYQYLMKPWGSIELKLVIEQARTTYTLKKENCDLTRQLEEKNVSLEETNSTLSEVNAVLKQDIKRRQQVERSLKDSEEKFRVFTQASQDMIFLFDQQGRCLYSNPKVEKVLNYQMADLLDRDLRTTVHPGDLPMLVSKVKALLGGDELPFPTEIRVQDKNGCYFTTEINLFSMDLERGEQIFGSIVRDVSKRKKAEQQLLSSEQRLRELTGALLTAQDDERRRLSMELHDDFGQSMTVLKLQIRSLKDFLNTSPNLEKGEIVNRLEDLRLFANGLTENIRRLSREIWPMIVDNLGIDAALSHLQSSFQEVSKIQIEIINCGIGPLLSLTRQRHLYRIIQESLNNVIKHAGAQKVVIRIDQGDGRFVVDIEDDGIGFDVESVIRSTGAKRGIGLQSINERVQMLEGQMEINSSPGQGTVLHFTLPAQTDPPCGQ